MANEIEKNYGMQQIIKKAMNYAFEKHKTQTRKGSKIPYFVHLMDVASILIKEGASENLIAAGFLHDIVEDRDKTGVTEEMLRQEFDKEIVDLVMAVTEPDHGEMTKEEKIATWRKRKQESIDHLKHASKDVQMLKCADKLSTIRDMISDYKIKGDEIWKKLNSPNGKPDQKWYFGEVINNLKDIKNTKMYKELKEEFKSLFGGNRKGMLKN